MTPKSPVRDVPHPTGLTSDEARRRLERFGPNTIPDGYAYFQDLTDPVTISPFLNDFQDRLENQYQVTIEALNEKGVQPVKLRTELPGLKIQGPTHIYVR